MIRFLLRTLGVLCLAVAFVAVVVDGTRSIAARAVTVSDLRASLGQVSAGTLQGVQDAVGTARSLPNAVVGFLLAQPTAAVFGVVAIVLMLLGRRRSRRNVGFAT